MLAEWHVTPDYIINNWSDELFSVMCDKLSERKEREQATNRGHSTKSNTVSAEELSVAGGDLIKVVKKHGD